MIGISQQCFLLVLIVVLRVAVASDLLLLAEMVH